MKSPKPCIFCGASGNKTKEHFYPAWLAGHIPTGDIHNVSTVGTQLGLGPKNIAQRYRRQGHLITKTLRVVCQTCNNGWMSQLEAAVKPTLESGLAGRAKQLEASELSVLAQWVTMKSILAEHADVGLASTPAVDRYAFFQSRRIPAYFRLFLGAHSTASVTWLYRHSSTISFSSTVQPPLLDGLSRNVQTVTFILGRLVFHVLAARVEGFELDRDITYPGLTPIWPPPPGPVSTAALRKLTGPELASLRESFEAYLAHQRPRFVDNVI